VEKVEPLTVFSDDIKNELARIESIFGQAKLPYMFDSAGVVDAFYSILAFRLKSFGISFHGKAGDFQESLLSWSTLQQAIDLAHSWKSI
jgi:glutathione S-transferase